MSDTITKDTNETRVTQRPRRWGLSPVGTFLWGLVVFVAFALYFAGNWYVQVYGRIGFDAVLFTLQSSLSGVQSDLVLSYLEGGLVPALIVATVINFFLFFQPKHRLTLPRKGGEMILYPLHKWVSVAMAALLSVYALASAAVQVQLTDYIQDMLNHSQLFEEEYVDPKDVSITFPEQKRNLVYIYLESMEVSYLSQELGGAMEENLIPELYEIARENTNFSHNDGVGGFHETSGASWTIGAMVAHTAGIPLKTPSGEQNDYGDDESFLPGVTSITNILSDAGYYTTLMVGSDANFGGRKPYFLQHGADHIYDVYTARRDGIIPNDYFVWWGMEDLHLFEYAKQELTEISQKDQPFAFTMLTVDTHHIGGYQCALCTDEFEEPYEQSISCSSRQVLSFLQWLQEQPFYENTTVIITGDHCSMDKGYFSRNVDEDYNRMVYNVIINAPVSSDNTKNRDYCAVDLFPTTLATLGCEIEGDRLGLGTNLYSDLPTLAEEMGFERFNKQLAMASKYYAKNFYVDRDGAEG